MASVRAIRLFRCALRIERRAITRSGDACRVEELVERGELALHRRWRVTAGSALMPHLDARIEEVARHVGYGSARALCHAFAAAGLPSPRSGRRAL